jgi:pimeloyl-ACP methyl ester carboxylesterase
VLSQQFTCLALDRRGYGASGDAPDYALAREHEDIAAVAEAFGESVSLIGHSSGAVCALGAARLTPVIKGMVLCEPPLPIGRPLAGKRTLQLLQSALAEGNRERAWRIGMRRVVKLTSAEIERVRRASSWEATLKWVPRWVRELAELDRLTSEVERCRQLSLPTLLLLGSETSEHHARASLALKQALPRASITLLADQGHVTMGNLAGIGALALELTRFVNGQSASLDRFRELEISPSGPARPAGVAR